MAIFEKQDNFDVDAEARAMVMSGVKDARDSISLMRKERTATTPCGWHVEHTKVRKPCVRLYFPYPLPILSQLLFASMAVGDISTFREYVKVIGQSYQIYAPSP